eukprot:SAG31_NODE_27419_length_426_cov_0.911315_1_plen_48_part_10
MPMPAMMPGRRAARARAAACDDDDARARGARAARAPDETSSQHASVMM